MNHEGRDGSWYVAIVAFFVVSFALPPATARAQDDHFEIGTQVAIARSGEFDANDTGIGGRFAWRPIDLIGAEAEMNVYPRQFPRPGPGGFSRGRIEGLFGVTVGPTLGSVRPFAKARPGLVTFRGEPVVCILIFPPPLSCQLAAGRTVFALDLGGGIDVLAVSRTFMRIELGDRLLRYPGPSSRDVRVEITHTGRTLSRTADSSFFSHDFRLAVGAGLRF